MRMPAMTRDVRLIYASAFLRAVSTGMIGVLLGLYLARLGFNPSQTGGVVGAGLAGAAVASLAATLWGDLRGRRRMLFEFALLGTVGAALTTMASLPLAVGAAAFVGMLNGMGRDRGASLILEQAALPSVSSPSDRTRVFAWYNVIQDAGHALGALLSGLPTLIQNIEPGIPDIPAFRASLWLYVVLAASTCLIYARLSRDVEAPLDAPRAPLTPQARKILWKISALFGLDGLGGGFLTASLLSYFFFVRFHAGPGVIGLLFFGARVANAFSHLGAAWLAKRIGLVNTMVFTHIPSSLLLVTVAFAPTFPVAAILFLLREGLVEMDVPTRQSYVMAVVRPEERTRASGVTHLVRIASWAVAPFLAGPLMQGVSLLAPLVMGAGMKIAYDILLYISFRNIHPPEEGQTDQTAAS